MSRVKLPQLLFNGTLQSTRHNYIVTNLMNKAFQSKTRRFHYRSKTNHPLANPEGPAGGCPQVNKFEQVWGWGDLQINTRWVAWGPQLNTFEQVLSHKQTIIMTDGHDGKDDLDANYMRGW